MGEKYVIKFVGEGDMLVENEPTQELRFDYGVLHVRDWRGVEWAYAPGEWKSIHRLETPKEEA